MKKSAIAILLMLVVSMFMVVAVQAQETLTPGTPVTGEITDDAFALEYTFEGEADQVVVIELAPVDPLGNLVLRYPRDADPSRMKKDLDRLLRVSRIG